MASIIEFYIPQNLRTSRQHESRVKHSWPASHNSRSVKSKLTIALEPARLRISLPQIGSLMPKEPTHNLVGSFLHSAAAPHR